MTDELKTSFYWDWKDEYFDSFYVEYANGTDYYEDVRIGNEYLKCFLNGDRGDLRGIPLGNKKGNRNDCLFYCSSAENRTRI